MATRSVPAPSFSPRASAGPIGRPRAQRATVLVVLGTLGAAGLFGLLVAVSLKLAVLGLIAAVLLPVGLWSVPALVAAWLSVVYLGGLPGLAAFPNRTLLVALACGVVALTANLVRRVSLVPSGRVILPVFAAFVFWQLLSLTWAGDVAFAEEQVKSFVYLAAGVVLVLATIRTRRHVRWLALAFVVGAVASVAGGVLQGGLTAATTSGVSTDTATSRFTGGAGDANYLAAMLVPALMLAGGLSVRRSPVLRAGLLVSVLVMAVGLAATQSRGGLIALVVSFTAAFFLLREQRRLVVGAMGASLSGLVVFFVSYPAAWQRIVGVDDGGSGSGRTGIWSVAWKIVTEHPLIGVGLNQFSIVSPTYVRRPGSLSGATGLIVDKQIVVHNVFLQLWAETGLIGLVLFLAVIVATFAGAARAAREFDLAGEVEMAAISRAVILALIGVLTASFFLSNILARQIWVLLALGPVLLTVARTEARARLSSAPAPR